MDFTVNYLIFSSKKRCFKACCFVYDMRTVEAVDREYVLMKKKVIILSE